MRAGSTDPALRALCRQTMLETKAVTCVIGYEMGSLGVRPSFAHSPEEADKLIWNEQCTYNLVNYVTNPNGGESIGTRWNSTTFGAVKTTACASMFLLALHRSQRFLRYARTLAISARIFCSSPPGVSMTSQPS